MNRFYFLLISIILSQIIYAQEVDTTMWVTDGSVHAIARGENTIYLGGDFSFVGPNTGSGVLLNDTDGSFAEEKQAYIKGSVNVSVSDGKGGWYIGGDFTTVEKVNRKGLAHINSDGSLDRTWNPILNGNVNTIAIFNNIIYI